MIFGRFFLIFGGFFLIYGGFFGIFEGFLNDFWCSSEKRRFWRRLPAKNFDKNSTLVSLSIVIIAHVTFNLFLQFHSECENKSELTGIPDFNLENLASL